MEARFVMVILVCGNRDWSNVETIEDWLVPFSRKFGAHVTMRHGNAPGADTIAETIAFHFGWRVESFHAQWERDGNAAGPIRNAAMIADGKVQRCLAFGMLARGSKRTGTGDMVAKCGAAGIITTIVPVPGLKP